MKIWLKRAVRTFIQTAAGYISVNLAVVPFTEDMSVWKSALIGLGISAVSAGMAAVMNIKEE